MGTFSGNINVMSRVDFLGKLTFEQIFVEQWNEPYGYVIKAFFCWKKLLCVSTEACTCVVCEHGKRKWLELRGKKGS